MRNTIQKLAALVVMVAAPGASFAFTTWDTFGSFPAATWGGSGIPNDAVAVAKQFVNGSTTITIAMAATGRYSNPATTNDGNGVYFAGAGSNDGLDGGGHSVGATWNWNYYISVVGGGKSIKDYQIDIWYDLDPTGPIVDPDTAGLGRINVTQAVGSYVVNLAEDSQNLMFDYLAGIPAYAHVTPPGGLFNPNATGNYQFLLTVKNLSGTVPYDSVAMEVQVVPVPAAVWLFGSALGLVGVMRRRATA